MGDAHVRAYSTRLGKARWELRLRIGGRETSRTFDNEKAARTWLARAKSWGPEAALAGIDANDEPAVDTATVEGAVRAHIEALSGISDGTRAKYYREAERDLYPHLGTVPLVNLTATAVAQWVNVLAAQGLAGKTIKNRHSVLSAACRRAVEDRVLEVNPCRGVRLPRTLRRDPVFLTPAQVGELVHALRSGPPGWAHHVDAVVTLLGTGMRWSEMAALQAQYVTVDGPVVVVVRVAQAWKEARGQLVLGPPKSPRSLRSIPVPTASPAGEALQRAVEGKRGASWVFTGRRGGVLRGSTFHDGVWQPAMDALGWEPRPRPHDLRHTCASLMIANGSPIEAVSRILGHEKTSTTWDVYGHLLPGAQGAALGGLGETLGAALRPTVRDAAEDGTASPDPVRTVGRRQERRRRG